MNFILLTGPPAVGKLTVGNALAKRLGYKILSNHDSIELALKFYYFGDKAFNEISDGIRKLVFDTTAKHKEIEGMIFTLVWAFNMESDWEYVADIKSRYESNGWKFHIVELYADLETRLQRNVMPDRLEAKPSKRNLENSRKNLIETDEEHQVSSGGNMVKDENYVYIDNTDLSPEQVVDQIVTRFNFSLLDS